MLGKDHFAKSTNKVLLATYGGVAFLSIGISSESSFNDFSHYEKI